MTDFKIGDIFYVRFAVLAISFIGVKQGYYQIEGITAKHIKAVCLDDKTIHEICSCYECAKGMEIIFNEADAYEDDI